jgi:hypothetical protein
MLLRPCCYLLFLFLCTRCVVPATAPPVSTPALMRFVEDERWGYLDTLGTVVLKPRYWAAGPFSEGRAAVREDGLYGYIDYRGHYLLPPAYEYATEFVYGRALVWQAARPRLIDRAGRGLTPPGVYRSLEWIVDQAEHRAYLWVSGTQDHVGLLDANGRVLFDTIYSEVSYLGAGRFELLRQDWTRERHDPDNPADTTTYLSRGDVHRTVADHHGRLLIPFDCYDAVNAFAEGLAIAELPAAKPEAEYSDYHVLDTLGHVVARLPGRRYFLMYDDLFQDGVLVAAQHPSGPYDVNADDYPAVLDRRGHLLFADSSLESLSPYARGRAFAETKTGAWYLVDKTGRRLNRQPFGHQVGPTLLNNLAPAFEQGVEVVRVDSTGLQLIDSTGEATGPVRRFPFAFQDVRRQGSLVVFTDSRQLSEHHYDVRLGFWDLSTDLIIPPRFQGLGAGFVHGLLPVQLDKRQAYLNRAGHLCWLQPEANSSSHQLNLDQLNRAAYTAHSPEVRHFRGLGGWASSTNQAHRLPGASAMPGQLRVSVDAQPTDTLYQRRYSGHHLYISNASPDTVLFNAQDSMLDLILQARDPTGSWRDIEYLPRSFCGNSYHTLFLGPGEYWELAVPAYAGSQPTRLRARLQSRPHQSQPPHIWYSNEWAGCVNPGQFWRKRGFAFSANIMNPYLD